METGMIFNIQRFCVHDGPGIRTSVFMKGCPLSCAWCHNPEGISRGALIGYDERKCALCGACVQVCPDHHKVADGKHVFSREGCAKCQKCVRACAYGALDAAGREESCEDVMAVVRRDAPYYAQSGGGLTLTGGEPTHQMAFARALCEAAKRDGIHVCVETSGFCARDALLLLAKNVDLFLFDIKETDPALHKAFTGADAALILENLRALDRAGAKVILRCPLIPGFNAREAHMENVAKLANELSCVQGVELEPYHPLGIGKAARFGLPVRPDLPSGLMPPEDARKMLDVLSRATHKRASIS